MFAIRHLQSGLFFDHGEWATDAKLAQHFDERKKVQKTAFDYRLKHIEMVFLDEEFRITGGTLIPDPTAM